MVYILRTDGTDKLVKFHEKTNWKYWNIRCIFTLSFQNNKILTDIYSKLSCHPENTTKKRLILYSLAAYAKHICTDNNLHTNKRKETQFFNN